MVRPKAHVGVVGRMASAILGRSNFLKRLLGRKKCRYGLACYQLRDRSEKEIGTIYILIGKVFREK